MDVNITKYTKYIIYTIIIIVITIIFYFSITTFSKISYFKQIVSNEDNIKNEKNTIEELQEELIQLKNALKHKTNINIETINPPPPQIPFNPIIEYDRKKLYDPLIDPSQRYVASQVPTPQIASITNIATQNIYDSYHRVGLLIAENENSDNDSNISNISIVPENQVLELFSRMLYQYFYQYYTAITMGQKIIKVTINRDSGQEYYNGDIVHIPELKTKYRVQIDKRDQIYYNPYFPNGV